MCSNDSSSSASRARACTPIVARADREIEREHGCLRGRGHRCPLRRQPASPEPPDAHLGRLRPEVLCERRQVPGDAEARWITRRPTRRCAGVRDRFFRSGALDAGPGRFAGATPRRLASSVRGRFFQDPLRRPSLDFDSDDRPACYPVVSGRISLRSVREVRYVDEDPRRRRRIGRVGDDCRCGGRDHAVVVARVLECCRRDDVYAADARRPTFNQRCGDARRPARVTASIARCRTLARLIPGVLLLVAFIPVHVILWDKFPVWYHFTFLRFARSFRPIWVGRGEGWQSNLVRERLEEIHFPFLVRVVLPRTQENPLLVVSVRADEAAWQLVHGDMSSG